MRKQVEAPRTDVTLTPEKLGTIERRTVSVPERTEWTQILCQANANTTVISAIQRSLKTQGFYQGAIDGTLGQQTYNAVAQFEKSRGLPQSSAGAITLTTVDALGVDWRSLVGSGGSFGGTTTTGSTGFATGSTSGFSSGQTVTAGSQTLSVNGVAYTLLSNGQVANSAGSIIGSIDGSGNLVGTNGSIIARSVVSLSGGGFGSGSLSGTAGNVISGSGAGGAISGGSFGSGASGGAISAGGFSVRADGSVVNSSGAVIGRVDGSGNIVDASGNIIGSVTPR